MTLASRAEYYEDVKEQKQEKLDTFVSAPRKMFNC